MAALCIAAYNSEQEKYDGAYMVDQVPLLPRETEPVSLEVFEEKSNDRNFNCRVHEKAHEDAENGKEEDIDSPFVHITATNRTWTNLPPPSSIYLRTISKQLDTYTDIPRH